MTLRLGVCLPQFVEDPTITLDAAVEAERLGYDSVTLFDHLSPLGGPPDRPILECFTMLGAVAARTHRESLLPLVARAGLRYPAMTAHLAHSLHRISDGRFVLGLGAGDAISAGEDRSVGLPERDQPDRQADVVATVEKMRELAPDVAVWLGGTSPTMQRLAGRIADGWNVWALGADAVAKGAATVAASAAEVGRPMPVVSWGGQVLLDESADAAASRVADWGSGRRPADMGGLVHGDPAAVAARLRLLADAGVGECLLSFVGGRADEQRHVFAALVMPLLRD
jgi:alkanesulfonate monooxygenase SsuD/methylene tetrahydromethanopterin reductase-like flavin-dependent oxidoreductase (luciferase family)